MNSENQQILQNDIMRYKPNKLASTFALLSIIFNCLYFCLLYSYRDLFFSTWRLGISVILTLITLLATFMSSEGIKAYNKKYAIPLIVLAVVQIIRMFGFPLEALTYDIKNGTEAFTMRYFGIDLSPAASYIILVLWLACSAACLVASAVIGYIRAERLEQFTAKVESGEIDVDKTLKDIEAEETASVNASVAEQPADGGEV